MFGKIPKMLHPPVLPVEKLCVPLPPEMYISKAKKYRDQGDCTAIAYDYYCLTKSYIDKDGKTKLRSVLCLGELPGFGKDERNRQTAMFTIMIEHG